MGRLKSSRVAVFGIGGVGGYVVEALARSGIGALDLIDDDKVCLTNLNRQIIATRKTLGKYKVDAAKERVLDINPECEVRTYRTFFLPETKDQFDFRDYDYVVDAIDTVTGKLAIIEEAKAAGVPVISSMGAGNKVNPALFEVEDIYGTSVCPLARVMRHECKKRGIDSLKVVYSKEKPISPREDASPDSGADPIDPSKTDPIDPSKADPIDPSKADPIAFPDAEKRSLKRRAIPGSTAFVPSVAGLIIAGEVINDLVGSMAE